MYGTRPDIPGFHFHDKRRRADIYFPRAGDAALVEKEQAGGRLGIVTGGSTYGCVFTGGALTGQIDVRTAEQKEAMADYARIAQRSFGEVENALATETALREREAILAAAIRDNERALELAQIQYRVGRVDFRVVEQRQLALYGARSTRLHVQAEQLAQRVNLYLALGGSFDDVVLAPVAASEPVSFRTQN